MKIQSIGLLRNKVQYPEAEYRALASTAADLYWIRQLLRGLQIFGNHPPLLWSDNKSAIQLAHNPVFHGRTKHIKVDFHFIREKVVPKDMPSTCSNTITTG